MEIDFDEEHDGSTGFVGPFLNQIKIQFNHKIKFIYAFGNHWIGNDEELILITDNDDVYCIGDNVSGCLGFGHEDQVDELRKNEFLSNMNIIKFDNLGCVSIFCLTMDGHVYGWGRNSYGEDIGDHTYTPKLLTGHLDKIFIDIKSNGNGTMALTDDNQVYMWGKNYFRQIFNYPKNRIITPAMVMQEKVASVYSTYTSSYIVLENSRIYGWGDNEEGQLCLGHFDRVTEPTLIENLGAINIKELSCGFAHVLLLEKDGNLFAWGDNEYGQLGDGTQEKRNILHLIPIKDVSNILAFGYTSCFSTENGDVFICGELTARGDKILMPTKIKKTFVEILKGLNNFKITINWRSKQDYSEIELAKTSLKGTDPYDVILVNDSNKIEAHKIILSSSSTVLKKIINYDLKRGDSNGNQINIEGIDFEVLQSMINFMYGYPFESELAVQLLIAADFYDFKRLHKEAEKHLVRNLKLENVAEFTNLGENYNSISLKNAAQNLLKEKHINDYKLMFTRNKKS